MGTKLKTVEIKPFVSSLSRSKWSITFFKLLIVLSTIAVAIDAITIFAIKDITSGQDVSSTRMLIVDTIDGLVAFIWLLVFLVNSVLFLRWFHQVYANLPALGVINRKYSTKRAVVFWFIPFVNMFKPFEIMKEIWTVGELSIQVDGKQKEQNMRLLGSWWGLFLIGGFIGNFASRLLMQGEGAGQYLISTWLYLTSDLLYAVAAYLSIMVIRTITEKQEKLYTRNEVSLLEENVQY